MVGGITKYAAFIDDPQSIRYHLERAWHLAQSGRPGPCWLDVPVDVQAAPIDPESLRAYDPAEDGAQQTSHPTAPLFLPSAARFSNAFAAPSVL